MARLKRSLLKEAFWRLVVGEHAASGLSLRAFCQRKVVSEASFYFWRRELVVRDREISLLPDTRAMLPVRVFESEHVLTLLPETDDRVLHLGEEERQVRKSTAISFDRPALGPASREVLFTFRGR